MHHTLLTQQNHYFEAILHSEHEQFYFPGYIQEHQTSVHITKVYA